MKPASEPLQLRLELLRLRGALQRRQAGRAWRALTSSTSGPRPSEWLSAATAALQQRPWLLISAAGLLMRALRTRPAVGGLLAAAATLGVRLAVKRGRSGPQ